MDGLASLEFSNEDESIDDEQASLGSDKSGDDTPNIISMTHGFTEDVSDIAGNVQHQTEGVRTEHRYINSNKDGSVTTDDDAERREASDNAVSDGGTCGSSVAYEELAADQVDADD